MGLSFTDRCNMGVSYSPKNFQKNKSVVASAERRVFLALTEDELMKKIESVRVNMMNIYNNNIDMVNIITCDRIKYCLLVFNGDITKATLMAIGNHFDPSEYEDPNVY